MTVAAATTMLFAAQTATAQEETGMETTMEQTEQSQDFQEITTDKLPAAVTKAVEQDYAGATVSKAYINEKNEFKLVLETEAGAEPMTVYADANGEWIKPEESK